MSNVSGELCINMTIEQALQDKKMEYFCYIHDDMIFTKDWLKIMIEEIEKEKDCYLMGCNTIQHKKAYMIPDERRNRVAEALRENKTERSGVPMFLIKRECLEKVGMFDEGYAFGECSDNDYFKRIEEAGKRFLKTHRTVIFHGEKITRLNMPEYTKNVIKSKEYFLKKHNGADLLQWGGKTFKYVRIDNEEWKVW